MKTLLLIVCVLTFLGISQTTQAQQTYFYAPNSKTTGEGDLFIQNNSFMTTGFDYSQTSVMYGIEKNTEVGGTLLYYNADALWYGINAQHRIDLNENHKLTVGGAYYFASNNPFWLNAMVTANKFISKANLNLGLYFGNAGMFGKSNIGLIGGIDYPVLNNKVLLKGEIITGDHWMGGLNVGASFNISNNLSAGFGLNAINFNSGKNAAILQLHYNMPK